MITSALRLTPTASFGPAATLFALPFAPLFALLFAAGGCSQQTCTSLHHRAKACGLREIPPDFVARCEQAAERAKAAARPLPPKTKASLLSLVEQETREVVACGKHGDCAAFRACLERRRALVQQRQADLLVEWTLSTTSPSYALKLCQDYRKQVSAGVLRRCEDLKRTAWRRMVARADAAIAGRGDFSCLDARELAKILGRRLESKALCREVERAGAVRRGISAAQSNLKNTVAELPQDCLLRNMSFLQQTKRPVIRTALKRLKTLCYLKLARLVFHDALENGRCYDSEQLVKAAKDAGATIGAPPKTIAEVERRCPPSAPE